LFVLSRWRRELFDTDMGKNSVQSHLGEASIGTLGRKPIMRYRPATMEEVRKCLDFCSADMKVDVKSDVPLVAKTVGDLCSLSSWHPGLTLNFSSRGDRYPESVVVVERAS
jgi:hypothetical protein